MATRRYAFFNFQDAVVSFAAVIRVVTRHATLLPRCVTTLITAAKETRDAEVVFTGLQVTTLNLFLVLKLRLRCSGRKSILIQFISSRRLESQNVEFGFEFEFEFEFIMSTLFRRCVR